MSLQLTMFPPKTDWRPPSMGELPDWAGAKRISIDVETKDPQLKKLGPGVRRDGYVVGYGFQIEDGPGHYLPIRHAGGDNMPEDQVLAYLRDMAMKFTGTLVAGNSQYDLDYSAEEGIVFPNIKIVRDPQIAAPLCNELHHSYSMEAIAERLGIPGKDETLLKAAIAAFSGPRKNQKLDIKRDLWKLPGRFVGEYCEADNVLNLRALRILERQIDAEELWPIYDLESKVTPILVAMRRRGVLINRDQLQHVEDWTVTEEMKALAHVKRETGIEIKFGDTNKKGPVAEALRRINVDLPKTESGQDQIDAELLGSVSHPVAQSLAWAKKVSKLRTTFAQSIRTHMIGDRLHPSFNQLRRTGRDGEEKGARYGRLSSSDPNIQQQPSRDEFAAMWRMIYLPDEGYKYWLCADYSQQEPRWLTHYAELARDKWGNQLPKAYEAAEAYRNDPLTDNHQMMAEICGIPRKAAKIIFLGICYGMGGAKLARDLGLPTKWIFDEKRGVDRLVAGDEAQALLDQFNDRAPYVRRLGYLASDKAKKRGYIVTAGGRKCRFPEKASGGYDWTHKALNRLIQGSSADQTKAAMVALWEAGVRLQLQVHDEVDLSVNTKEEAIEVGRIMESCVPCGVPSKVDLEWGPSWGEIQEVA